MDHHVVATIVILKFVDRVSADATFRPGVECYDGTHIALLSVAGLLLIGFVLGLPLVVLKLLRSVRSTVRTSDTNFWRRYGMSYVLFDSRQ